LIKHPFPAPAFTAIRGFAVRSAMEMTAPPPPAAQMGQG